MSKPNVRIAFLAFAFVGTVFTPAACRGGEFSGANGAGTGGATGPDGSTGDGAAETSVGASGGSDGSAAGSDGAPEASEASGGGDDGGNDCVGVDLQTDPAHCGACHHDCLGGGCLAGVCQPVILFQNDQHPQAGGIGTLGQLQLVRGAPSLLVWIDVGDLGAPGATGMVWSMLADGTGLTQLAPSGTTEPRYLTLGAAKVYWTGSEGAVWDNNFGGNSPVNLVSNLQPGALRGIATAGNDVWFVEGPAIKHVNVLNLAVVDTVVTGAGPADLVLSDGKLYFCDSAGGTVDRVDGDQVVHLAQGQDSPRGLYAEAGADGSLFWLDGPGAVWKLPKSGAVIPERLAQSIYVIDANAQNLTADAEFVYWASWGPCVNSQGCLNGDGGLDPIFGGVQRVRKDGTDRDVLFAGSVLPTGIAVDDDAVYWTTWWFTVLNKLAK